MKFLTKNQLEHDHHNVDGDERHSHNRLNGENQRDELIFD